MAKCSGKHSAESSESVSQITKTISKKSKSSAQSSEDSDSEDDEFYEIEAVRDHRIIKHVNSTAVELLVKWKGYDEKDNTWQSFISFAQDSPEMIKNYLCKLTKKIEMRDEPKEEEEEEDSTKSEKVVSQNKDERQYSTEEVQRLLKD